MEIPVSQMINGALRLLGVKATGNQITGEQANNAVYTLCELADSFNSDGDLIYAKQILRAPVNGGVVTGGDGTINFTIGPATANFTPTFNIATRPAYISFASFEITTQYPYIDYPITLINAEEWQAIRLKNIQSAISFYGYLDQQWPVGNFYVWPQPNQGGNLVLVCWQSLPSDLTWSSTINIPQGYARLFRYELAMNLAPEYDKPIPADVSSVAAKLKKQLAGTNIKQGRLQYSSDCQGSRNQGLFNIYTDDYV